MLLSAGTKLGPYEIVAPLGAGGMGEVYRARDPRMGREVAIKVSAERFSDRFEREVHAVAALNHPNICHLYDVGPNYLVMELVEGPTLAERIKEGVPPLEEALNIGRQIADALEAAHEKGIVHRDLKPANIKITPEGAVKVLDFGLAKMAEPAGAAENPQVSPTLTIEATRAGQILGTAAYMAPEQARGKPLDKRADIWAFGVVLYEMLTGRRLFEGESVTDTLAAVLTTEPQWERVPSKARPLLRSCLEKDPKRRLRDIGDAWRLLEEGPLPDGRGSVSVMRLAGVAALFAVAAAVMTTLFLRQEKPVPRPLRFTINTPEGTLLPNLPTSAVPAMSPDGENILFAATSVGKPQVYLHSLTTGTTRPLSGTEGALNAYWSFDSRSFLVVRAGTLSRMDLGGGPPQALPLPFEAVSLSWGPEGVVTAGDAPLYWFQPDGSGVRQLRAPGPSEPGGLWRPSLIPGGRWLLYNALTSCCTGAVLAAVHLLTTDGTTDKALFTADSPALYAAPGYALYVRGRVLMARPLDPKTGELRGDAGPLVEDVATSGPAGGGLFSASANGILVYRPGSGAADSQLIWFDRTGKNLGTVGSPAEYSNPALSPDGSRVAVSIRDAGSQWRDIWVFDLVRSTAAKLTFDPKDDMNPVWSPDGSRIAFTSDRSGVRNIYVKNAYGTGAEELLLESKTEQNAEDWSRDGRSIVYNSLIAGDARDLWTLSPDTRKSQPFLATRFNEDQAQFSPDGKWIAYRSNESGHSEVYVQPFAGSDSGSRGKWLVSNAGGSEPRWRADGQELFYASLDTPAKIIAVDISEKSGAIVPGIPHALFEVRLGLLGRNRFVVTADGKKFLAVVPVEHKPDNSINVIVNWPSLLRK